MAGSNPAIASAVLSGCLSPGGNARLQMDDIAETLTEHLSPAAFSETSPVHGHDVLEGCMPILSLPPRNPLRTSIAMTMDDCYDGDLDYSASDSIGEIECQTAHQLHILGRSMPTLVDIMRAEKPTFRRASQIVMRRPLARPILSPIQVSERTRRSSSESRTYSYSSHDHSSRSSTPTTPSLDDDEGSSSMVSDAAPSSPGTPKSFFEQERQCFVPYKQDNSSTPIVTIIPEEISKARKPSRLRLFQRKSFMLNTGPGSQMDVAKFSPQTTPTILEAGNRSASDFFDLDTPRPASPALSTAEPLTAKLIPSKPSWRDVGKPRFLRRMESRIGLNAATVRMEID